MTELLVRTEFLGGSPLARAAMDGTLAAWYPGVPTTSSGWRTRADEVRRAGNRRWLESLREALTPTGAAAERLQRVADGNGIVVTTGQQPGLFGGPVYTWSKALSALALADEIEFVTGVPCAPVFWAANDDADFAEASWTAIAVTGGADRLSVAATAAVGRPMSEMPLGDVSSPLEALVRACGATIDSRAIDAVRAAYRPGATIGSAYLALLRSLFEPLGIAVLDAAHPHVAATSRPLLVRALDRAELVAKALHDRDAAIRDAGFVPQVSEVAGLSLVFERAAAGGDKRRVPLAEAAAVMADRDGARVLSPNVLLRPVVERAMMPTAAYVAGPGEFAYFAQVSAVASALDAAAPVAVPRWSTTIIEPHITRILDRLGIPASELAEPHVTEGRLARASVSPALNDALAEFRASVARGAETTAAALTATDLSLPEAVVDGAQRAMAHRLDRVERRIVAAAKRREADTMTQIGTARGALFPLGTRQERALNFIPFLARHGSIVIDRMRAAARMHARSVLGVDLLTGEHPTRAAASGPPSRIVGADHGDTTRTADA